MNWPPKHFRSLNFVGEVMPGTKEGILKIVEIVSGQFGQVDLEKKYEVVEKAVLRCQQKPDETADSFLARMNVAWTEIEANQVKLSEIQAYVVLRGRRREESFGRIWSRKWRNIEHGQSHFCN